MNDTNTRILNAAYHLSADRGWTSVTMSAVADAAGVSRQSVYNEFGNRQALAQAMVSREVDRFLTAVTAELAAGSDPVDAGCRASDRVFAMAESNPLLLSLLSAAAGAEAELLPLLTTQARPVIDVAVARVSGTLRDTFRLTDPELPLVVDALVRVILSRLVQPGGNDAEAMHALVGRLLG